MSPIRVAALGGCAAVLAFGMAAAAAGDPPPPLHLPAAITLMTAKGTLRLTRTGRVVRVRPRRLPFPRDAAWFPATGSWYALRHDHLVIGRWAATVWRSRRHFPSRYRLDVVNVGPRTVAFSYGIGGAQQLWMAPFGAPERAVARGEFPILWTRGGLFTYRFHGRQLRLRSASGRLLATIAAHPLSYGSASPGNALFFVLRRQLWRAVADRVVAIDRLDRLGLPHDNSLLMQPVGNLVELAGNHRLVVVYPNGATFATARLPRGEDLSGWISARPGGRALAFTTLAGSGGSARETVYVLRRGARAADPVERLTVDTSGCGFGSGLAWHGRWLLFSASDGHVSAIDTGRRRVLDLTARLRALAGQGGLSATWAGHPPAL